MRPFVERITPLQPLIILALLVAVTSDLIGNSTSLHRYEYTQVHMGLPVHIVLYAPNEQAASAAAREAFARVAALDQMMSHFRADSELRRIEEAGGRWVRTSTELFAVLQRAVEIARLTDGAFDPSVGPLTTLWRIARTSGRKPDRAELETARARVGWRHIELDAARRSIRLALPGMGIDLGGIAKGFILQEALRLLRSRGIRRALVEAGGDIVVGDAPSGGDGWRIDTPGAEPTFIDRAARLTNAALATSGATAQFVEIDGISYSHVIDPRTGFGLTNHFVARVIAQDAATADAVATALTVLGSEGARALVARLPGVVVSMNREPRSPFPCLTVLSFSNR